MAQNVSATGRTTVDQLREQASVVGQDVQELGRIAKSCASEGLHQGREKVEVWEKQMEDKVREKPMQAILIAAGIGCVLGFLLTRR